MNNAVNRFFLYLVLLPSSLYSRMGVNMHHLKAILNAKLIMDDRRPNTFQQTKRNKGKVSSKATIFTMIFSAVLGCFYLFAFVVSDNYVTRLTFYFSMYIFMLASMLISDFTSVLIDIRDNYIILPKPVNDRTVVVARLLHIFIHICKIVVPMSLAGIILTCFLHSVMGGMLLFLFIFLATLLTLFLINALYIFILKVTTPEKFQRIIGNFQIVFAILIYASYQVIPRLIGKAHLEDFDISGVRGIWAAPSFWFAKAWDAVMTLDFSGMNVLAILLAFVSPLLSVWIVVKYFAPSFNRKLSLINSSNPEVAAPVTTKVRTRKPGLVNRMAHWFNKPGSERMSYLLTWKMTGRSKDFKMKVYPTIGYMFVIAILPVFTSEKFSFVAAADDPTKLQKVLIMMIYLCSFIVMSSLNQVFYSDKFKASWIFYSTPVNTPGELISGALKAAISKFFLPIALLFAVIGLVVIGPGFLPNVILAISNELLICFVVMYLSAEELPFSMQQSTNLKAGSLIRSIFLLIFPVILGVLHFLLARFMIVIIIMAVLSVIATWTMHTTVRNISWKKIKGKYQEA